MEATTLRVWCLELSGAEEEFPFGPETSVFKVAGKIFALTALDRTPLQISLKCEPELAVALRDSYPCIRPGYHLNKRHWNTVTLDETLSDQLVRDLIEDSYDLVVSALPKHTREKLGWTAAEPPWVDDRVDRSRATGYGRTMRAYGRMLIALGRFRWFSWLTYTAFVPVDRLLYKRSGGRLSIAHVGVRRRGALQTLLLTTTGRRSREPRSTPVLYLEDGDRLVVVASNFGRERDPAWSGNLLADPKAKVQIRDREHSVVARPATDEEKKALWPSLLELYPAWDAYTERTDRSFRAFFLEPGTVT